MSRAVCPQRFSAVPLCLPNSIRTLRYGVRSTTYLPTCLPTYLLGCLSSPTTPSWRPPLNLNFPSLPHSSRPLVLFCLSSLSLVLLFSLYLRPLPSPPPTSDQQQEGPKQKSHLQTDAAPGHAPHLSRQLDQFGFADSRLDGALAAILTPFCRPPSYPPFDRVRLSSVPLLSLSLVHCPPRVVCYGTRVSCVPTILCLPFVPEHPSGRRRQTLPSTTSRTAASFRLCIFHHHLSFLRLLLRIWRFATPRVKKKNQSSHFVLFCLADCGDGDARSAAATCTGQSRRPDEYPQQSRPAAVAQCSSTTASRLWLLLDGRGV